LRQTTLFNALTGLRARVGNYAGVTVEQEGRLLGGALITVLDLPGRTASVQSSTTVARDVLLGRLPEVATPAVVIVVVDASN
jgi:ferrous iron transport protein B